MNEHRTLSVDLRPKTFDEIVGNSKVVTALQNKLATSSPIATLFSGPAGCGKTTLALILGRAFQSSKWTDPEQLDIREINAADFNGVDDVRELVRSAGMRPLYGDYTVIILDEAHKLTEPAQNVLLKPFEDKDSSTRWIICTTDPSKLIKPLRDRCLSFQLRPLAPGEIQALVVRADEQLNAFGDDKVFVDFCKALYDKDLCSPREILMAYEKFANGIPADEAIAGAEHEPLYADIAKSMLAGDCRATREMLSKIKTSDARAVRSVAAAFLNGAMLKITSRAEFELYHECAKAFERNAYEDGVAKMFTTDAILMACLLIAESKAVKKQ